MRNGGMKCALVTLVLISLGLIIGFSSAVFVKVVTPHEVAIASIDGLSLLYVSETGANRVSVFDLNGISANLFVDTFGNPVNYFPPVPAADQRCDQATPPKVIWDGVKFPRGIVVDKFGSAYVSDSRGLILKFDKTGAPDPNWDIALYGQEKPKCGDIQRDSQGGQRYVGPQFGGAPQGIAYDALNHVLYVADTGFSRVVKIDAATAKIVWSVSSLNGPRGVSTDALGVIVYVADTFNNRVVLLNNDGTPITGSLWETLGNTLNGPSEVTDCRAKGVYVSDTYNDRILVFQWNGNLVKTIEGIGRPFGIACDSAGTVYVVSYSTNSVVIP